MIVLMLCVSWLSCDSILGFGDKFGYDYKTIKLFQSTNMGGFRVYYTEYNNNSAFLGFRIKTTGYWVTEDEEFKKYSTETSKWYKWHIKKVRNSYVEIGVKED